VTTRDRLRTLGLGVTLLAGAVVFGLAVNPHYQVSKWLFLRYAEYFGIVGAWALSCAASGYALIRKLRFRLALVDEVALGFPLGVLCFSQAIFLLGLVGALRTATFFLLPLVFAGAAAPTLRRDAPALRALFTRLVPRHIGLPALVLIGLGALGVGLLYVQIITPDGFSFDVRWYHIPLAQRYALSHGIRPSPEGFWMAAYPQIATYLYTWIFLAPGMLLFDRLELCSHLEFVLFLATLAQVPLVVRRLVPRGPVGLTWVMPLAFPAVYLYDSNLHAGADHVAGFFALPMALAMRRAWTHFRVKDVLLFSIFLCAIALTKYTAELLVIPAGFALLGRALYLMLARRNARTAWALLTLFLAPIAITSVHWLKNLIWFGDPIYPLLHQYLPIHPSNPDLPVQLDIVAAVGRPGTFTLDGLLEALKATFTFSFVANDWYVLRHDFPYFGSLFTLTLPCLLFVRGGRRIVGFYALAMSALFSWYLLSHYERFLQCLLPIIAAATAGCAVRIWQAGVWVRLAAAPLLVLQLAWGSDAPFIRTHNLLGDSPLRRAAQFIPSGFEQVPNRLSVFEPMPTLGRAVPKNAVVLPHDMMTILGLDRNWVTDLHQSRISYGLLYEPERIDRELKELGVTHLMWPVFSIGRDTLAGDLAFLNYALNYTTPLLSYAGYNVSALPKRTPKRAAGDRAALYVCGAPYSSGWYRLSQLRLPVIGPVTAPLPEAPVSEQPSELEQADYVVVDTSCKTVQPGPPFVHASSRGALALYVRHRPAN